MQTNHKELSGSCCSWAALLSLMMMKCVFSLPSSAACLFRYNALSFVYLIYLLLLPLFPEPTSTTMQGKGVSTSASASSAESRLLSQHPRAELLNPKQPCSRELWHEAEIGTKFSLFFKKNEAQIQPDLNSRDVSIIRNTLGFGKPNPRVLNLQNKH